MIFFKLSSSSTKTALFYQPVTEFNSLIVQDRPGEQWITMRGKFGDTEDIKIEVTMFDGYEVIPKLGDDSSGENLRLHISLLVDISKGDGCSDMEFVCSAWPDSLEVQKVYVFQRDGIPAKRYIGPDFRYESFFVAGLTLCSLVLV